MTNHSYFNLAGAGDVLGHRLTDLPCDPRFCKLQWLGIVADANAAVTFYMDNVNLEVVNTLRPVIVSRKALAAGFCGNAWPGFTAG